MEREKNRFLWYLRKGPLRRYRMIQRRLGLRRVTCSYFGARFGVDLADEVGYLVAAGRYEHDDISRFVSACRSLRPDVFVDVGANIGVYSCIAGVHDLAPRIVAIEPAPDNFAALTSHLAMNGLAQRTHSIRMAAGASVAQVDLVRDDPRNSGVIRVASSRHGRDSISMRPLDEIDLPRSKPIAIKIDVEGHELDVLRGAAGFMRANWGYAQIEAIGDQVEPVTDAMASLGWQRVDRHGLNAMFMRTRPT